MSHRDTAAATGPPALPPGYSLCRPAESDLVAAQGVLDACETADTGEPRRHENELAVDWRDPKTDTGRDWWLVRAPDGTVVGVAWLFPEGGEVTVDHYVHPQHRGLGIGEALMAVYEQRALEMVATGKVATHLLTWCAATDAVRRAALARRGYAPERQYFEMVAELPVGAGASSLPAGMRMAPFRPGIDDAAAHQAHDEAFAEHHLYQPESLEEWRLYHLGTERADPTLWRLAWDGDELAGYVAAAVLETHAVVSDVLVRAPWRGRGVGLVLLHAVFRELHLRGAHVVRLFVDAANVTGATRLYERAGMRVSRRFDVMQKQLR